MPLFFLRQRTYVRRVSHSLFKERTVPLKIRRNHKGYTLIEVSVSAGLLGVLTLIVATLIIKTTDTYGRLSAGTYAARRANQCLESISSEVRECLKISVADPFSAPPQTPVQDALMTTSARQSDGSFRVDAQGFSSPASLALFYVNDSSEGIRQLVRHQLYYDEDLFLYTPPFAVSATPYAGDDIVIVDSFGNVININRSTGAVGAAAPLTTPTPLVNGIESFDIVNDGAGPLEIRIICRVVDRRSQIATKRFTASIEPRNS